MYKDTFMKKSSVEPHGGRLINLLVDDNRHALLKDIALKLPDITLNERQLCDLECLASGIFSPLTGFMNRSGYESVLDRMRLQDGTFWPIPICLDLNSSVSRSLEAGQSLALRDPEGYLLAVMHITDIWEADREKEALNVYGTTDRQHPGVEYLFKMTGDYYIGGELEVLNLPVHFDFKKYRMSPREIRQIHQKFGQERIIAYQTTSPIHRPQYEITIDAMREIGGSLLLLPITGITRPSDFDHYVRVRCYQQVASHYPPDSFLFNLLPLAMRMAGPRDAMLHAIISKNFGCTHYIVNYNHGNPGNDERGNLFYKSEEVYHLSGEFSEEIGIAPVPVQKMVYLPFEDEFRVEDQVPEGIQSISITGADIRERIRNGKNVPDWATFPGVMAELQKAFPPPSKQGFTLFLTGLSGAGKSTIAQVLYSRFLELGDRPVTLLDGDIVRQNLSSELNFSKEHRDINVRRIGFVASEITKNRGIAICAPIAPYLETRREIRRAIEQYGGFIEIYICTPIEECEKRDRKGMYAKARAGLIKGFTGVDDPYEEPPACELNIDTTSITPEKAVQEILLFLAQRKYM